MSKYLGKNFYEPIRDIDGNPIMETVNPSQEEINAAIEEGKKRIVAKQKPVTILDILKQVLRRDLTEYGPNGSILAHDIHHAKKDEIYSLLIKLAAVKDDENEVVLDVEEGKLIVERANKALLAEAYGFIKKFINEGATPSVQAPKQRRK